MTRINTNRNGFLVTSKLDGFRTYACADKNALGELIRRLTGRELESFPRTGNTWQISGVGIAVGLHIYSTYEDGL